MPSGAMASGLRLAGTRFLVTVLLLAPVTSLDFYAFFQARPLLGEGHRNNASRRLTRAPLYEVQVGVALLARCFMRRDRKLPPFISNQLPLATRSTAAVKVQTEDDESEWRSQSSPWWHPMELEWKSFHAWTLTSFKSWDVHLTRLIYYYRNHKILMILVKGKDSWLWVHFCFIFKIKALKYNCLSRLGPRQISNLPFLGQFSGNLFGIVKGGIDAEKNWNFDLCLW